MMQSKPLPERHLQHSLALPQIIGELAIIALAGLFIWLRVGTLPYLAAQDRLILMWLWIVAMLLGYLLGDRYAAPQYLPRTISGLLVTVLLATLILIAECFLLDYRQALLALLPIQGLLLVLAVLWQVLALRNRRPLVLGVALIDPYNPLLRDPRLEYRMLSPNDAGALSELDGLLIQPDRPNQIQQQMITNAQAMKLPLISKSLLDEELVGKVALSSLHSEWLNKHAFQSSYAPFKRFFDVFFTLLSLPVLLPLMAVVAVVVYFNSGRPILFWQERVGKDGVPFRLVKFRTMSRDSEKSGPAFAQHSDQRVTPVGAFLRKFRLDELPQFYNVLRGEMSIIGPRPEQWAFVAEFEESIPLYATRHWVRPGITGWAQVNQGYAAGVDETTEKLNYDFYYIKHHSFQTDLLIVWKTLLTILTGFGAR